MELGIHAQAYQDDPGIVLLRPQLLRPGTGRCPRWPPEPKSTCRAKWIGCLPAVPRRQPVLSRAAKGPAGQLRRQEPLRRGQYLHLAGLANCPPRAIATAAASCTAWPLPTRAQMFDGGWLLPLGQEESLTRNPQRLSAIAR